jgi:hypothetical protein
MIASLSRSKGACGQLNASKLEFEIVGTTVYDLGLSY